MQNENRRVLSWIGVISDHAASLALALGVISLIALAAGNPEAAERISGISVNVIIFILFQPFVFLAVMLMIKLSKTDVANRDLTEFFHKKNK